MSSKCDGFASEQIATHLDYFGARYMSSAQGRFTSVEPAFESEILELPLGTATATFTTILSV